MGRMLAMEEARARARAWPSTNFSGIGSHREATGRRLWVDARGQRCTSGALPSEGLLFDARLADLTAGSSGCLEREYPSYPVPGVSVNTSALSVEDVVVEQVQSSMDMIGPTLPLNLHRRRTYFESSVDSLPVRRMLLQLPKSSF